MSSFDDGTSKCKRAVGSLSVMEKNHKTHLIAVGFDDVGKSLQKGQRHEFNPSVVAMAERMLITVWIMIFQVSLFFIGSLVKGFVFSLFYFGCWLLAVSFWLLALHVVMLNLVQHLTASLFLFFSADRS